jgi:LysR family transcriptional regulator, hypochlorite-specific transcription factor HypT
MELKWLEDFLSLAETRNFSRSAELRNTTQPAFSRRIKTLEDWVGAVLIDRSAQPVALTEAGASFRSLAEEVVRLLYQGREEIHLASVNVANAVKVAATHSLSLTFFPRWIHAVEAAAGPVNIRLDSGHAGACVQMMQRGECHFMLCHTHPSVDVGLNPQQFVSRPVGHDRLLPVALPDDNGGATDFLDAPAGTCRYLAYAETSAIGRAVQHLLERPPHPVHLDKLFVSRLAAVLKSMVLDGKGLAWLPESHVAQELESGQLVRAGSPAWDLDIEITIFRPRDHLPRAAESFWNAVNAQTRDVQRSADSSRRQDRLPNPTMSPG